MDLGLKGRAAIVCDSSSDIGLAVAESLAEELRRASMPTFASDRAAYVSGTVILVDGALTRGL